MRSRASFKHSAVACLVACVFILAFRAIEDPIISKGGVILSASTYYWWVGGPSDYTLQCIGIILFVVLVPNPFIAIPGILLTVAAYEYKNRGG